VPGCDAPEATSGQADVTVLESVKFDAMAGLLPLDGAGNSVKGQLVAKFLSQRLGMDLFVSKPDG